MFSSCEHTWFLGLPQSSRALPLLVPSTPSASSFCLSCPQAAVIQHSTGVDADIRPKMTTFKGLIPSLGELIQGHSYHKSTAFKPLTSITTETMAAPERMVYVSEITAQHLAKDKDLRASIPVINTPVSSGGTDTSFWDLREALVPLLPPTSTPPVFRLICPQVLISQNSPSVFKPSTFAQAEAIAEKRASTSELVEQHLSMDMDLQSLPTTPIFSETTSASPSRLGTALCLSSLAKKIKEALLRVQGQSWNSTKMSITHPSYVLFATLTGTLCRYPSWDDFCCSFQAAENTGEENKKGGCPCFMAWTNTGGEDKNLLSRLLSSTP